MARPSSAYFGTDLQPAVSDKTGPLPPMEGASGRAIPRTPAPIGGDPLAGMPDNEAAEGEYPTLGNGGGVDPQVAPADSIKSSNTLYDWVSQTLGIPQEKAGDLTLREVGELIQQYAPDRQDLLNALGTQMTDTGAVPPEAPSMGPSMRYSPDDVTPPMPD